MDPVELPFNEIVMLHFAAYYRIKSSIKDAFPEVLRKEIIF